MHSEGSVEDLVVALERLLRYVRHASAAGGLSMSAAALMSRLEREGPRRLTELARAEGISQPGMTQLVARMEREGLVCRVASADDRRAVLVEVTDAGRELLRERHAERAKALEQVLARLNPREQAAVVIAIPALAREVGQSAEQSDPARQDRLDS